MAENPLVGLQKIGQSIWLDFLSRELINSGALKRLVDEGVTGVTSNPSIFQKAISGSGDYDQSLREMLRAGVREEKELFFGLAMKDVADAADMLRPVYDETGGMDGFISIEVSPDIAYDADATVLEAGHLFSTIGRKNILVKVPGTKQALPAIEQLVSEGININVTLLFSVKRYEEVMDAYISGLEKRLKAGQSIDEIWSVASFFVSRVDTTVDRLLEAELSRAGSEAGRERLLKGLTGGAAVANAKIAYRKYREVFSSSRFTDLKGKGANVQRLLWGSTSAKNPAYSDIKYVQELIGPGIINTVPEDTMQAFKDHGEARVTIEDGCEAAEGLVRELGSLGIDIEAVAAGLEQEGVKAFSDAFFSLLEEIAKKRDRFLSETAV